jgi:hypothetical protein
MISFQCFSQEPNAQNPFIELEDVVVSAVNSKYFSSVQDVNTPEVVASLQQLAANYDVKYNPYFSEDALNDVFEVAFRNPKGYITALYNNRGKIEAAYGRFRNIPLTKEIQKRLYQSNQGWTLTGTIFSSAYEENNRYDRSYKVHLKKGNYKKSVVINMPR